MLSNDEGSIHSPFQTLMRQAPFRMLTTQREVE